MVARSRSRGRTRSLFRFVALVLALAVPAGALTVVAVTFGDDIVSALRPGERSSTATGASGEAIQSSATAKDCSPQSPTSSEPVESADPGTILVELSRRLYPCADRVVVAGIEPTARWTGARIAMDDDAVFLVAGNGSELQLQEELARLDPAKVVLVDVPPETASTLEGDWELVEQSADPNARPPIPPDDAAPRLWAVDETGGNLGALLTPAATDAGASIIELGPPSGAPPAGDSAPDTSSTDTSSTTAPPADTSSADTSSTETSSTETSSSSTPPPSTAPGDIPSGDLLDADPDLVARLRAAETVQLLGPFTETETWQLEALRSGVELPGGGLTIGPNKRYIAFYGAPDTSVLGVLGEQDPAASLERMQPLLAEYRTDDGVVVVPTFELIATVAAAEAGDDGDYSNETSVAALRPYVDFAAANGIYVLLDLQPGRTDFLTQAKLYEELLIQPHVGLALDPEWRLAPDQRHLRQFGSVDAAEINEVSGWLADLVRQHALPQKMLLIHQFNLSMVTNRSAIAERPELSAVIQMDGQGPLGTKYGTLAALVRGAENSHWRWGWKNFYDEDSPMATPAQTLAVDPQPVYVSYQ